MGFADAVYALERFYPHLAEQHGSVSRAWLVLDSIDAEESQARVEAWRRADSYTYLPPEQSPRARSGAPLFGAKASPIRELRVVSRRDRSSSSRRAGCFADRPRGQYRRYHPSPAR